MKLNYKLFMLVNILAWLMLLIGIIALEAVHLDPVVWMIVSIVSLIVVVFLHVYLLVVYVKNRKRIERLKEQYVDTMKPKQPLRFCPTDEELVKSYYESKNVISQSNDKQTEETEEKTQEESEIEIG